MLKLNMVTYYWCYRDLAGNTHYIKIFFQYVLEFQGILTQCRVPQHLSKILTTGHVEVLGQSHEEEAEKIILHPLLTAIWR